MNKKIKPEGPLVRVSAAIVDRTDEENLKLLTINDPEKKEVASGYFDFSRLRRNAVMSVPGGTRVLDSSEPKTREQVLQESIHRETGFLVPLSELKRGLVQPDPFLLGREQLATIERVASTSMLYFLDELPEKYQDYIKEKNKKGIAGWQLLAYLAELFQAKKSQDGRKHFRQHVLVMAHIWHLLLAQEWSGEAVLWQVNANNQITGRVINAASRKKNKPLGETAFGSDSQVLMPYGLEKGLYAFLYGMFETE